MKELVRVRLLTLVRRLCGLVGPLIAGSASQAKPLFCEIASPPCKDADHQQNPIIMKVFCGGSGMCGHGVVGEVPANVRRWVLTLARASDKDVGRLICEELSHTVDLLAWKAYFRGFTIEALLARDCHGILCYWFRYLILHAASAVNERGAIATACQRAIVCQRLSQRLLRGNRCFVMDLGTIAQELMDTSPCDCVGKLANPEGPGLVERVLCFLTESHSGEDIVALNRCSLELMNLLDAAALVKWQWLHEAADALMGRDAAISAVFNAIRLCSEYSCTSSAEVCAPERSVTCRCAAPVLIPAGLVVLDMYTHISCGQCGAICHLLPSHESMVVGSSQLLAVRLLATLACSSRAFSQTVHARQCILVSAMECATLPIAFRYNLARVIIPIAQQIKLPGQLLGAIADLLWDVCKLPLDCQAQYVDDTVGLATVLLQCHGGAVKAAILSKSLREPTAAGVVPMLPAAVCNLLVRHTMSIGTGLEATQARHRDTFGRDSRPRVVICAMDFLLALQLAGVSVRSQVKIPRRIRATHRTEVVTFGQFVEGGVRILEALFDRVRSRHSKAQLQMLRGLTPALPVYSCWDVDGAAAMGYTIAWR